MDHLGQYAYTLFANFVALGLILFALTSIVIGPRRAGRLTGLLGMHLLRMLGRLMRRNIKNTIRLIGILVVCFVKGAWWLLLQLRVKKSLH